MYSPEGGKRVEGGCFASSHPFSTSAFQIDKLPRVNVMVNGVMVIALVDTGCSNSLVESDLVERCYGKSNLIAFDGREVESQGHSNVELCVAGQTVRADLMVVERIACDFKVII